MLRECYHSHYCERSKLFTTVHVVICFMALWQIALGLTIDSSSVAVVIDSSGRTCDVYVIIMSIIYLCVNIYTVRHKKLHIVLCSVLRPRQHSIGHLGDCFYRSKDPTNSIKVLKEMLQRTKNCTLVGLATT